MKQPVVLVGVGEMGGVFARGLLRLGHPVYPVTRSVRMDELAQELPEPAMVLIAVAAELIDIQEALSVSRFDRERLIAAVAQAFRADPEHKCMGRSAPARLARALEQGERLGMALPTLQSLRQRTA